MAQCDQGYLCAVCGQEVKRLIDSSLYLQYVIGWTAPEQLDRTPEIHLRCNPHLSQFIDSPEFQPPVVVEDEFDRRLLDAELAARRTELVTRGYQRLRQLQRDRSLPIQQYPLVPTSD